MERRKFIVASVGTLVTTSSGCLSSDDDSPEDTPDNGPSQDSPDGDPSQDTADTDPTAEPTEEGPDDDIGNYDPEAVAERYYEALDNGDKSTLTDLSHSDGVVIHTNGHRADALEGSYDLTIKRTELVFEDFLYFYQPSALVEVGYEQDRQGNSTSLTTRDEVILVVEDGELLVYDTKGQNEYIRPAPLDDSCEIEGDYDIEDRLPLLSEDFYEVDRDESFGVWEADYRGPDGNWFFLEFGYHDSDEEAEEVELGVGVTHKKGDGEWTTEAGLLARKDNLTCNVCVDNADATDHVEALYQEVGCFTDDDIVERSW